MFARGLSAASLGLACGCAGAVPAPTPPPGASPWALVSVVGTEGTLERHDEATQTWRAECSGTCGVYVPSSGTYRLRSAASTSAPFSLPAPDLERVVLRFDDDGHVWAQVTPRLPRQPQPFVPRLVLFLR